MVVLDPPKLIPGRLDIAAGKRKYFDLNVLAMRLVEPGGLLLTCSCSGLLPAEEFLVLLRAAARVAGRSAQVLAVTGASPDHPVGLEALEGAYLKAVWLRLGDASVKPPADLSGSDDLGDDYDVDSDPDTDPVRRCRCRRSRGPRPGLPPEALQAVGYDSRRRLPAGTGDAAAVPSLTVENYVKSIALIAARAKGGNPPVATGELAQTLGVSPGTVTGMLKTLSEANLATYTPYEGARLTDAGQRLAMKVIRRHRLLELFLVETLKMPWDEVHEEAEHMEHAASERLIDRIDAFLGHPAVDPHGDPIPSADGILAETEGVPLVASPPTSRSGSSGWSTRTPPSCATFPRAASTSTPGARCWRTGPSPGRWSSALRLRVIRSRWGMRQPPRSS